ncbi:cytochrome P450 [Dichomitus squalens]|uniref:Cytochrome P450 n=2 Tax=Dichomitus squalens TaxID=114155 RepID=A0A4Q9NI01_9APHY|nr:cytochrome P450 [Dichomitus squalens LYAD-421 SS1]EJF56159.1 cytochrome P450 [Dichomitus squalens LYAD-421 SS1]TBU38826.1 cytochrome P450 [Dichomitus squalens]TBU58516.1 cytochrome P450 [Dichomitus squalens]
MGSNKLPPGPPGLPILGNLFDIPPVEPWHVFYKWARQYGVNSGEVVYLQVLGRPVVLLNSVQACNDLFEGRHAIYSDRPHFPLMDLMGSGWDIPMMTYGQKWRTLRRIFSTKYSVASSLVSFYDEHRRSSVVFLQHVLNSPNEWANHIRLRQGQTIMGATYGIPIESRQDPLIRTADEYMGAVSLALSPAMWLVNPLWMTIPGVRQWRRSAEELRTKPFMMAKEAFNKGIGRPSYVTSFLQEGHVDEQAICDTAAVAYGAGYETSVISADVFFLAMVLYPDVRNRAQEELDRVVGNDRLPDFTDRDRLPYISAIMKEVLRWHPPAPTGVPHLLQEDDVYNGFYLPKGTVVMGNVWGLLHNPEMYPEPERFMPERFIRDGAFDCSANDPSRFTFGFGRRVCPGRVFSEDSIWLLAARFLSVFDISPADPKALPEVSFTGGAAPRVKPFECIIRPRSTAAAELVEVSARA